MNATELKEFSMLAQASYAHFVGSDGAVVDDLIDSPNGAFSKPRYDAPNRMLPT